MIYRTYKCDGCDQMFEVCHESGSEPSPDCPVCSKVLEWRPTKVSIGGSLEGRSVKLAQDILENDFQLSNYKDNNRDGDVGYIDPTRKTTAENDVIMQRESEAGREVLSRMKDVTPQQQQAVDGFFGGQSVKVGQNSIPAQQMIAAGKMGPAAGVNPMELLHRAGKEGKLPTNFRYIRES